jgi:hypothetical protein
VNAVLNLAASLNPGRMIEQTKKAENSWCSLRISQQIQRSDIEPGKFAEMGSADTNREH